MDEVLELDPAPPRPKKLGWPPGLTRPNWAIAKRKGYTLEEVREAMNRGDNTPFVVPEQPGTQPSAASAASVIPPLPKPPANRADDWRTRHQLRDPFEYPVDMSPGNRFHIPVEDFPPGFDMNWKVAKIWQQPQPTEIAQDRRMGWIPVLHRDFDDKFWGRWHPEDYEGEIEVGGLILCARPKTWSDKARLLAEREARGQLKIKVDQIRGGEMPGVTMDSRHPSALAANRIGSEWERVQAPTTPVDK